MRVYLTKTLNSMAIGLFASLIIGVILEQIGLLLSFDILIQFGQIAKFLMGPAIGVAVAYGLQAPPLVIMASAVTGALGAGTFQATDAGFIAGIGEPVGAFVAAAIGIEVGRRLLGKTPVDILVLPASTIIAGGLAGIFIGPVVAGLMTLIGATINELTNLHPIPMGILIATAMGMLLTLPISSAAIAISLGLSGLAAGAATVGCCAQMIGFATASWRENKWSGFLAQGLGTSMLQIPNIVQNPKIWLPPIAASVILGPLATTLFQMENIPTGAGMGTSGLVGQIGTISAMGYQALPSIALLHFILPSILTLLVAEFLRKIGWIRLGDMKLKV